MVDIEVLHMGMIFNQNFDYEGGDDLALGLPNDLSLMANSISTPTTPTPSKSFATPSNLDLDATNATWELLKVQLIHNQKIWIFHHMFFLPCHCFVINDDNGPHLVLVLTMQFLMCHSISQEYNTSNTT
jgi:hypothetical protein